MNSVGFIVFLKSTGEILRSGRCLAGDTELQAGGADEGVVPSPWPVPNGFDLTHYLEGADSAAPLIAERMPMGVAVSKSTLSPDGVDEIVFSNLPEEVEATLIHPDAVVEVLRHDGSIEFSTALIGAYSLRLRGVRYLAETFTFEAHA